MPPSGPEADSEAGGKASETAADTETEAEYDAAVAKAAADPDVLAAVLVGSRATGGPFLRPGSDWDLRVVVADPALEAAAERLEQGHGSRVEVALIRLSTFEAMATPGSISAWDRPSFLHPRLVFDKTDGHVTRTLEGLARLTPEMGHAVAADSLDGYVNSYYRSRKNAAIGLEIEALLDAGESIAPLLTCLFAIHDRVRPFNRHLGWELASWPLGDGWLAGGVLLPRLRGIVAGGAVADQAALFRDVEQLARAHGLAPVIDGWEPDVAGLRGGDPPAGRG
jgi:predicted nucleotidyltransferase